GAGAIVPVEDAAVMLIPVLESNLEAVDAAAEELDTAATLPPRPVPASPRQLPLPAPPVAAAPVRAAVPLPAPAAPAPASARTAPRSGSVNIRVATWAQYALLYTSDLCKG